MDDAGFDQSAGADSSRAKEDDSFSYAPSVLEDDTEPAVPEAPVDRNEGEPLPDDRIVPFQPEDEAVVIDGVTMNLECTLKVLQVGCDSLGLSHRGSKQKCLQRMIDHVKAQSLLAAHGAEIRLRGEAERRPVGQARPEEPLF